MKRSRKNLGRSPTFVMGENTGLSRNLSPVRFSGTLSKPGTATVAGAPATMDTTTRFSASPVLSPGAQNVPVTATDTSGNVRNQTYALTVGNAGSRSFAYDANGNMTNNGAGQTYAWDAADRLIKITYTGGATTEFVYNGAGQRVKIIEKASGGTITSEKTFIWCDEPQPCEERDASGTNVTKRFYSGLGQQIGGTNYYYTTDHLGSVRELTDSTGTVRARYDYDPYGRTTKTSGDLESDFGYTGFYRHQTSGLELTVFRAYDSNLGRWLSRDILAEDAGPNLYAYVMGESLGRVDPFGLDWFDSVANFSAGFGDSLSFGLTQKFRQWNGYDDVVDKCSGAYKTGVYTEVALEIASTGGSAALKAAARQASRSLVRAEARALTKDIVRNGNKLHHKNPLFGHPGGRPTLFPTGGLPAWLHSSKANLQLLSHTAHMAAHRSLRALEGVLKTIVNPVTTGVRAARAATNDN